MKLKIRYENTFQEIEVELREMEGWLDISVESDEPIDDREKRVQETVDILLNRPEYNNWHAMDRHRRLELYRRHSLLKMAGRKRRI